MKKALIFFVALCLFVGFFLIRGESLFYYLLGIAAIVAAVAYTAGPRPYGYVGLGDIFVFVFFGLAGVFGTYYLHTHQMDLDILLPAVSCGLFSVAVLNVNNIRDIESDKLAQKNTIPVRIGAEKALLYHWFLLLGGISCAVMFILLNYRTPWQWLFLLTVPLFLVNGIYLPLRIESQTVDPLLKQLSISTLIFCLSLGLGNIL